MFWISHRPKCMLNAITRIEYEGEQSALESVQLDLQHLSPFVGHCAAFAEKRVVIVALMTEGMHLLGHPKRMKWPNLLLEFPTKTGRTSESECLFVRIHLNRRTSQAEIRFHFRKQELDDAINITEPDREVQWNPGRPFSALCCNGFGAVNFNTHAVGAAPRNRHLKLGIT